MNSKGDKAMTNGIKSETVKRGADYIGRIAVYEDGKRLYSVETEIRRLSRGDALQDAQQAAHDLIVSNFEAAQ
jgi:hypothetical protein